MYNRTQDSKYTKGTAIQNAKRETGFLLLIALLALLPRLVGLNDFLTYDEAYHWIGRTERFAGALLDHEWAGTRQTGHPGVSLMWLGSLGLLLEHLAGASGSDTLTHLAWMRLPSALLQALFIPAGYLLLRRLLSARAARLAALFWATSPFLIAHARLLHMDGLLTDFVTFSVLCTLLAPRSTHPRSWLVAAGMFGGLALLTKGPSLILLPSTGLLLLWNPPIAPPSPLPTRLRSTFAAYLLWLGIALMLVFALWPALWVNPSAVLTRYVEKIIWEGSYPYPNAQFFFGRTVSDPGPLFYPVVLLFRLSPLATIGILLCPSLLRRPPLERRTLLALAAFALFWTIIMTVGPKKFDRYILPALPALLILAAVGWDALLERLGNRALLVPVLSLLFIAQIAPLIAYHPHYLSYYSPLVGGGATAQHVLLVGWGEGIDRVGAYLRQRPDIGYAPILAPDIRLLQPLVPVPVKHISEIDESTANYAILDRPSLQRQIYPDIAARLQPQEPIHRIQMHGIEYARIYQLPRPYEHPVGATFAESLHLHGVTIERQAGHIVVLPSWGVLRSPPTDYWVVLRLLDAAGETIVQIDTPPGGAETPPTSAWQPGAQVAVPLPLLLPETLPPGTYRLTLALYEQSTGARAVVTDGVMVRPEQAGPHTLLLYEMEQP